ncbi:MAG TPA: hypothetical protein VHE80_08720, partial [Acidimicrobiales bacterium]|nr:hypothetical protein [Acidimicrobiales bacterium]
MVPTVGRKSLVALLDALAASRGPAPGRLLLVDDRRRPAEPLPVGGRLPGLVTVLPGPARGPAA